MRIQLDRRAGARSEQRAVSTRTVESLAVAVANKAPFSVAIVEPKVPIVRGGSMDLKVVATRKPGFTAPILVSLPWNPSGIASKGEVVIPENGTEAVIPINANGGAELKTWRILANGTYIEPPPAPAAGTPKAQQQRRGNRGGRLVVSSEFARLTVAPQFLTLKFQAASVEQGKEVDLIVNVNKLTDFPAQRSSRSSVFPTRRPPSRSRSRTAIPRLCFTSKPT